MDIIIFKTTPPPEEKKESKRIKIDESLLAPPEPNFKKKSTSKRIYTIESTSEEKTCLLFELAKKGNAADLKKLISLGININAENFRGYTALMLATIRGHLNVIDVLIRANANIFLKDHKGRTTLHHAVIEKKEKAAFKLIGYMSREQRSILKHNAFFNEIVTKFESRTKKCDINAQNVKGETMFMLAARYGHEKTAKNLIMQGANIYLKDINGKTAEKQAEDYRESLRDLYPKRTEELYQSHILIFAFAKNQAHPLPRIDETETITEGIKNLQIDKKAPC